MSDFKKLLSSKGDMNASVLPIFEELTRSSLDDFLKMFQKDLYEKIDFTKGYEVLDEAMPYFMPPKVEKNSFYLFIKAHLKTGKVTHFILNPILMLDIGQIKLGIADVPDKVVQQYYDTKAKGNLDQLLQYRQQQAKEANKKTYGEDQCSRCGRTDLPLTIALDIVNMEKQQLCSVCMHTGGVHNKKKKVSLDKLDKEIAELESLGKQYEELIKKMPKMPDVPSGLDKYAMTPLSMYKGLQALLGDLKAQRMAAMTEVDSENRLEYELKKSLEVEDYEKSAEIRDKLTAKGKGKK